uniref:Uncharacterized protein n=1 Tax=Oryza punctata TaxID=4537 RepID=A0A0E0LFR4_ORYPU
MLDPPHEFGESLSGILPVKKCVRRTKKGITFFALEVIGSESMEDQTAVAAGLDSRVKASLVLGTESFAISSESGILSEQLAAMKEKSMEILKAYITKHNAPADVPDEPIEGLSDDEGDAPAKNPPKKPKKQK